MTRFIFATSDDRKSCPALFVNNMNSKDHEHEEKVLFAGTVLFLGLTACRYQTSTTTGTWIDSVEEVAVYQLLSTASELADSTKMPRTAWAGYELPFLEEQLEHKVNIDSIHPNPAKSC